MGTKVALYDIDGQCLAESYRETEMLFPNPGWVEMDANAYIQNITFGIKDVLVKSGIPGEAVKGISSSGIVDGAVPVDEDMVPVGPFIPYLDMRAQEEAREIRETCEPIWVEESAKWGLGPDCVPMVIRWLYKNTDYVKKAKKFCNIAPFVMARLGGLKAKDAYVDWAHASGWLIGFDVTNNVWSEKQMAMYGIPMDVLPKIVAPYDVIGYVCEEIAAQTGLKAGTPLVAGAGDLMVSSLGAGCIGEGQAFDVAGTASIMTFVTKDVEAARKNKVLVTSKNIFKDELMLWGCLPSGGMANGWFRDGIMDMKGIGQAYPFMDMRAKDVPPGCHGLLWSPYLTGHMTPTWPEAKGGWLGMTPIHDLAHMWRSMMEAVAFEYRIFLASLEEQGVTYDRVVATGGGARSAVWNQIKSNILNLPYTLISTQDTGTLGCCCLAAYGSGEISDMAATVAKWTQETKTYTPQPEQVKFYDELYKVREEIFKGPLTEIFNMWNKVEALQPPR